MILVQNVMFNVRKDSFPQNNFFCLSANDIEMNCYPNMYIPMYQCYAVL